MLQVQQNRNSKANLPVDVLFNGEILYLRTDGRVDLCAKRKGIVVYGDINKFHTSVSLLYRSRKVNYIRKIQLFITATATYTPGIAKFRVRDYYLRKGRMKHLYMLKLPYANINIV
jgi:hypothetical protein